MSRPPDTLELAEDGRVMVEGFELLHGDGTRTLAGGDPVVVGSHERADLVLADATVSRFHCRIEVEEGQARVTDLGSRNGTRVDGVQVRSATLHPGAALLLGGTTLVYQPTGPRPVAASSRERFGLMVGRSARMRRLFAVLERASSSDATVLLLGETGTGKEVAAESIHQESKRAGGPLVVVDCSAIPADLLESELFGHEKGSFTGAERARVGAFTAAAGGTLFLDEIGELASALQPKLLRALESREIKPVGASRHVPIDVRVIAATHRDLIAEVNAKRFRADLYYRLAVVKVRLPALRERLDDLELLIARFLDGARRVSADARAQLFLPETLAALRQHAWPGNVRELRNHIERMLVVGPDAPLPASADIDAGQPLAQAREAWVAAQERRYAETLLARHEGNVTAAAAAAGVDRVTFYRLLWKHGLR